MVILCLSAQTADWKSNRRWRLLTIDSGTVSFAELRFIRVQGSTQKPQQPGSSSFDHDGQTSQTGTYKVVGVDITRAIANHMVMLTWPADARYSPLTSAQAESKGDDWSVRVLITPLLMNSNAPVGTSGNSTVLIFVMVHALAQVLAGTSSHWYSTLTIYCPPWYHVSIKCGYCRGKTLLQ